MFGWLQSSNSFNAIPEWMSTMPHDDDDDKKEDGPPAAATQATNRRSPRRLFSVPEPVKRVFDKFPLRSYPANDLPRRSLRSRHEHTLYVFTDSQRLNAPSFNPGCLKWQVSISAQALGLRETESAWTRPTLNSQAPHFTPFLQTIMLRQQDLYRSYSLQNQRQ